MPIPQEPEEFELDARSLAVRRLRKQRDFRRHLIAFVLFNTLIFTVWAMTDSSFPWFIFPLFGWGIGLVFHALDAYGSGITEADINREIERENSRRAA